MRSIFFFLTGTTRDEMARFISMIAMKNPPSSEGWISPDPGFYFRFYDDLDLDDDDGLWRAALNKTLGRPHDVAVSVDVTGTIPGHAEVRALAGSVLGIYAGVVCDDHSDYCWTLEEILSEAEPEGRSFFSSESHP